MSSIIRLQGITFYYEKTKKVLDRISLEISEGEIFGFLGPNGSGKSTLFRILATALKPVSGSIRIGQESWDGIREEKKIRGMLGIVFQSPSLDGKLTVLENLIFQGYFYGLSGKPLKERCHELLAHLGLSDRKKDLVGKLSGGLKRRVELARGLLHRPKFLILDEPSTGLDPSARAELWKYLKQIQKEDAVTILLTTHLMDEAEHCDRIAILNHGRIVSVGKPDELKKDIKKDVLQIKTSRAAELGRLLAERFQLKAQTEEDEILVECERGAELVPQVAQLLPDGIESMVLRRPTLGDVFMHQTGKHFWEEEKKENI